MTVTKFDYHVVPIQQLSASEIENVLDTYGEEGYALVSIERGFAILMRTVEETVPEAS